MAQRITKIFGVALASSVSVTALQAGVERSFGPVSWRVDPGAGGSGGPGPGNATFEIMAALQETPVAPHAQWFTVANLQGFSPAPPASGGEVHNPQAHDITYVWSFGDAGALPHPGTNLPSVWRDTNTAYGMQVAHTFAGPGTFTVTCWAYDRDGNFGTATTEITVQDPNAYFAGNRTICLNPTGDGNFTLAPAGAQQVNSWSAARSAAEALRPQPCRVLFKRGATYNNAVDYDWGDTAGGSAVSSIYVGSYGTGDLPYLRPPVTGGGHMFARLRNPTSQKWIDLHLHGWWDPETETGALREPIYQHGCDSPVLVHNCRIRGFEICLNPRTEDVELSFVASNCLLEDHKAFCAYVDGNAGRIDDRVAFIGCGLHQNVNALVGIEQGFFEGRLGQTNGPFRNPATPRMFVSCCSFFSNNGWSRDDNGISRATRSVVVPQAAFRGQADHSGGSYATTVPVLWNIERCVMEGGSPIMSLASSDCRPGNYILDKVIFLGNSQNEGHMLHLGHTGTTIRNCLFWMPPTNAFQRGTIAFILLRMSNVNAVNSARPVRVYGNTFYSDRSTAQQEFTTSGFNRQNIALLEQDAGFNDLVLENNVLHAPNQNAPLNAAAPLTQFTIPGLTTMYRGTRWNFPKLTTVIGASIPPGGTLTFAYPNDTGLHPIGVATNQAYFQARPQNNKHVLGIGTSNWGSTIDGRIAVTFTANNIAVTNTGSETYPPGNVHMLLDRSSDLMPRQGEWASPPEVSIPVPAAGSSALGTAVLGLRPVDDLLARPRPAAPSRGAYDPNA